MVLISSFTEADLISAYDIFKVGRMNPWSFDTFKQSALNDASLVARKNNTIVGYILLSRVLDEMTIEDITVHAKHRGEGIGRQLMEASFALAAGSSHIVIFLEVRVSNKAAIQLYRSLGFELIGERKNYYEVEISPQQHKIMDNKSVPRENALVMKKVLSVLSSN